MVPVAAAQTAPSLQQVAVGRVAIDQSSTNRTVVTQRGGNAIVDWRSFSVPTDYRVDFVQPSSTSILVNRVTGTSASVIDGSLTANGQIWLLNPNGILIGPNGRVSSVGFLASTQQILNEDFRTGRFRFGPRGGRGGASVVNRGRVESAAGGYAVLAGQVVGNEGAISAELGTAVLAGGSAFKLSIGGDRLIAFEVTEPLEALAGDGGSIVSNLGEIAAAGGRVLISARSAAAAAASVINIAGVVDASSARREGGVIILDGGLSGAVSVSGALKAGGDTSGGRIDIFADTIRLTGLAKLDVSGAAGGSIRVGGDTQGLNPDVSHASVVRIDRGASLVADGLAGGDGGKVVIWSDNETVFSGQISAAALGVGGNGGFIETSSKKRLYADGLADAHAVSGAAGAWLLDPEDVTVGGTTTTTTTTTTVTSSGTTTTTSTDSTNAIAVNSAAGTGTLASTTAVTSGTSGSTSTTSNSSTSEPANGSSLISAASVSTALSGGTNVTVQSSGVVTVAAPVTNSSPQTTLTITDTTVEKLANSGATSVTVGGATNAGSVTVQGVVTTSAATTVVASGTSVTVAQGGAVNSTGGSVSVVSGGSAVVDGTISATSSAPTPTAGTATPLATSASRSTSAKGYLPPG